MTEDKQSHCRGYLCNLAEVDGLWLCGAFGLDTSGGGDMG
jgi:hypothetical protein